MFCAALFGAGIGFLWYNTYPAQVFMGDVGSLSLGGAIGMLAVLTKNELVLLIVGGLFVVEALSRDHPDRRVQGDQAASRTARSSASACSRWRRSTTTTRRRAGTSRRSSCGSGWCRALLALLALGTLKLR